MTRVQPVSGWTFTTEVLRAPVPVVVDFRTPPEPTDTLAALAEEYAGRARVAILDPSADPELALCGLVEAGPVILFFDGGRPVDSAPATATLDDLRRRLGRLLCHAPAAVG